ncbi:DUF212-domain-containing protein [Coccomyxa subellipsoidea C-169]|uniref:DUF212-domain-containing protein n=1 Tax=Coccomyxa subellipsoidea (strain C-169) TaxID=574566 RepID=I0Z513_COCSC|nr:DUF212-domain-containing protein [Coccomyxa subellipsoidea C-169]EIE25732.1 DUF212-domain-containing protein [Coccomyxa subellipsoidea C-169]|eukprot:XP_005650276.1 DUF212-domain-containing protein [Coccomyxa subellipsoidea C-169]
MEERFLCADVTLADVRLLGSGGPPALAAAAVVVLPQLNGHGIGELLARNYVFKAGFCAWLFAQTAKIFTRRLKKGVWDIRAIVDSGGMPSSHSALCTAVTTAVGLEFGLASSLFAVSLCFTLITMYDATGVRYHSGKQAEVLNILVEDVMQGHPVSEQRLKEVLGHNPLEEIFEDPVVAADGFTYSRAAIGKWLKDGHDTSPMTNLPLDHKYVCPNMAVRREALEWMKADYRNAGETPAEAAARNVLRELKIEIAPNRFKYLCHASLLWQFRHQEPKGNGTADVALAFTAELSPEERQAISFDTTEYEDAKWVDPASIIQDASFHTALRRSMQHIVIRKRTEELHAAVEAAASDEEIAQLARVANQASIPSIEYPAETYLRLSKISKDGILCGIQTHLAYARNSAQKVLVDIERRPHAKVRSYSSSQERELLMKAAQAAETAAGLNAGAGLGSWIYKSLGLAS